MMKIVRGMALLFLIWSSSQVLFAQSYQVTASIPIGGKDHWDYLIVDPDNRRLYVSPQQ